MTAALEHPPPRHRRPRLTLYRYVAREAFGPTCFALVGLTIVVLTTSFLGYSELVINRGVAAGEVAWMVFYEAVPVAAQMLPFAVLVGSLVALGRLGAGLEILALEASGVAAARLVWPFVAFAGVATVPALLLSTELTPLASRRFDAALEEISRERPWAQLQAGRVNRFGGWRLDAQTVSPSGNELEGVLLWVPDVGQTLFARAAELSAGEGGALELTMYDGSVVLSADKKELQQLRFERATTLLPESDSGLARAEPDRIPGLPLAELIERARMWEPTDLDPLPRAALALHRRFAYPFATLLFGFLAVPLFLARGRFSRASGGVMGLLCTVAYYGLMQAGEGLVQSGGVSPAVGAWLANLVMAGVGAALLVLALRERVAGYSFDRPVSARRSWLRLPGLRAVLRGRRPAATPAKRARPRRNALARYVASRFVQLVGLSFSVLFAAYFVIDVLDRLSWFAEHQATATEILRFYSARGWLLASRAVPMALLVATALTVSLLAVEGELIGMRACGIPAPRALLPVLLVAAGVGLLYFLLNNVVVPRTNALADQLKREEIKDRRERRNMAMWRVGFWSRDGDQLIEAGYFDPERGRAEEITVYDLDASSLPIARTDCDSAFHIGNGLWRCSRPARVELSNGHLQRVAPPRHVKLGQTVKARVDTMHMPLDRIAEEARAIEAEGRDATPFWVDYHVRLAEPLACLVLPALVLFFAVAGPPFPGPAQTLLLSGVVGVAYILVVALASSLGRGNVVPPVVGAWGPIALFSAVTTWLGLRLLRRL